MDHGNNQELSLQFHSLVQESPTTMIVTFNLIDGEGGPSVADLSVRVDATGRKMEACVDVAEEKLMQRFNNMVGAYERTTKQMPRAFRHGR